jgi:DNA-binding LytR/AlgR family response regulator
MMRAIAIDDEPPALEIISHFCKKSELVHFEKGFTDPEEGLRYLKKFPVDLLFLDINMPGTNGIEILKRIENRPLVIFITAYSQYAVESYSLDAVDYLLKPFSEERFMKAVGKARDYLQLGINSLAQHGFFFVRADYSLIKINIHEIRYIEGLDDYLKIHLENSQMVVTRMTLKNILEKLPANDFVRVHRSFIVPLGKITSVKNKLIRLGETEIPLGNTYEEQFFKAIGTLNNESIIG